MEGDQRSFRVAVLEDRYVNPPDDGFDGLAVALEVGWGVIQLPPAEYGAAVTAPILAEVAEHVEEFSRRGYDIVLVGESARAEAFDALGIPPLDQISPSSADELARFLSARPSPPAASLLS